MQVFYLGGNIFIEVKQTFIKCPNHRQFPGGLMVSIRQFHHGSPSSTPGLGTEVPNQATACCGHKKTKTKTKSNAHLKNSMEPGYLICHCMNDGNYFLNSFYMVPLTQHNSDWGEKVGFKLCVKCSFRSVSCFNNNSSSQCLKVSCLL